MSNLAVYVVAYPAALRFLDAFWASLEPQLRTGFRLYFSLDGVSPDEVRATTGSDAAVKFLPAAPGASPAALRSASPDQLAPTYHGLIFLDLDYVPPHA